MTVASLSSGSSSAGPLYVSEDGDEFFELIHTYLNKKDQLRVQEAFDLARREHGDQSRRSGELFFTHPLTVAYYMAEYRLDTNALMAALLHDVAEDTVVSVDQIRTIFGAEVSQLVDGVTKLERIQRLSGTRKRPLAEAQAENVRKIVLATVKLVSKVISGLDIDIEKREDKEFSLRFRNSPHLPLAWKGTIEGALDYTGVEPNVRVVNHGHNDFEIVVGWS